VGELELAEFGIFLGGLEFGIFLGGLEFGIFLSMSGIFGIGRLDSGTFWIGMLLGTDGSLEPTPHPCPGFTLGSLGELVVVGFVSTAAVVRDPVGWLKGRPCSLGIRGKCDDISGMKGIDLRSGSLPVIGSSGIH